MKVMTKGITVSLWTAEWLLPATINYAGQMIEQGAENPISFSLAEDYLLAAASLAGQMEQDAMASVLMEQAKQAKAACRGETDLTGEQFAAAINEVAGKWNGGAS